MTYKPVGNFKLINTDNIAYIEQHGGPGNVGPTVPTCEIHFSGGATLLLWGTLGEITKTLFGEGDT